MEETPRTDKIVTDWLGGKISAAEMRRQFQDMERDLIRAQVKFVERVNDDKKYLIEQMCCVEMELDDCQAELVEARTEIKRLTLLSQNQQTIIDAQRSAAKTKDVLIEQMWEAFKRADDLLDEYASGKDYEHQDKEVRNMIKAVIEAAEGSG